MQPTASAPCDIVRLRVLPIAMPNLRGLARLLGLLAALVAPCSWAVLGQAPSPATTPPPAAAAAYPANAALLHANASKAGSTLYDVHSSQLESGTWVHEYTTHSGVVFALVWHGPVMPDLQTLMGTYADGFNQAVSASRSRRSLGAPLAIQSPALVVRSSGRRGHLSGYAYTPPLVPTGLDIHDVLP